MQYLALLSRWHTRQLLVLVMLHHRLCNPRTPDLPSILAPFVRPCTSWRHHPDHTWSDNLKGVAASMMRVCCSTGMLNSGREQPALEKWTKGVLLYLQMPYVLLLSGWIKGVKINFFRHRKTCLFFFGFSKNVYSNEYSTLKIHVMWNSIICWRYICEMYFLIFMSSFQLCNSVSMGFWRWRERNLFSLEKIKLQSGNAPIHRVMLRYIE